MTFAIDAGYGAIKAMIGGKLINIPSVVGIGPTEVGMLSMGVDDKRATRPDRIGFGGYEYLVGHNVGSYAAPVQSMDINRLGDTPELRALLYLTFARALGAGQHELCNPIVGFPVSVLRDKKVGRRIKAALESWLIGGHDFSRNGRHTNLLITGKVLALPQPAGTFYNWALSDNGAPAVDVNELMGMTAVLDIGKNTLDALVVEDGQINLRYTAGASLGTRTATDILMQSLQGLDEPAADKLLGSDNPMWGGEWVGNICEMAAAQAATLIADYVERLWQGSYVFSRILVTGGGSLMLKHELQTHLPDTALFVRSPVEANVRGLAKYGKLLEVRNG